MPHIFTPAWALPQPTSWVHVNTDWDSNGRVESTSYMSYRTTSHGCNNLEECTPVSAVITRLQVRGAIAKHVRPDFKQTRRKPVRICIYLARATQCRSDRPNNAARLPTPAWPWVGRLWPATATLYSCRPATKQQSGGFASLSFQPRGEDGKSKTPERENELLLRLAPCVDTGEGSDLFSKGTKRTQTHLVCFVFRQLCHSVFSKHCKMYNSPLRYVAARNPFNDRWWPQTTGNYRKEQNWILIVFYSVRQAQVFFCFFVFLKKGLSNIYLQMWQVWEQVKIWNATEKLLQIGCTCLDEKKKEITQQVATGKQSNLKK